MISLHAALILSALHISAVLKDTDAQTSNEQNHKLKNEAVFAKARKEALKDARLALQSFKSFMQETFMNDTGETMDIINTNHQGVAHLDQNKVFSSDYADWSALDNLPECSNQTNANDTICIEKQLGETHNNESIQEDDKTSTEIHFTPKSKRKVRRTRELLPIHPRKRRYSEKFMEYIKRLPSAVRVKLLNIPAKSHKKIESLSPAARNEFLKKLSVYKKEKKKKKKKGRKRIKVDLKSEYNVNRMHGYPLQLKEQKRRIRRYKKLYWQLDKYHQCNKEKADWFKKPWRNLKLYYKAAGQHVRLPCNLCARPDEKAEEYPLRWMRRQADKTELEDIDVLSADDPDKGNDDARFSWKPGGVLFITDLEVEDTGQYLCFNDNEYEAVHILEVVPQEPTQQVVGAMMLKEGKGKLPVKTERLTKYNLEVFTLWERWSPCSRCDARGTRSRYGSCYVKKIKQWKPVKPKDAKAFKYFPHGIACHSNFLPSYIQKIKQLLHRKSEIQLNYCFEECPNPPKSKVIRGKDGKKVEVLQSNRGYKKFKKKLKKIPHRVRRKTLYVKEGGKAQITCVRKIKPMSVVRWQKGYKILDPVTLPKTTNKRMMITSSHRLLMSDVKKSDKAIYSCWVDGTLRKTTKVKVYNAQNAGIKDKLVYLGVILSIVVIILMVINIGKNRKKGRKA